MSSGEIAFSVVIPSLCTVERPGIDRLRLAIAAWLAQRFASEFEVIVVDNASEPPLVDILNMDGPRLRILRLEDPGLCAAYNEGIQAARGEFVFLGIDDNLPQDSVLTCHAEAHRAQPRTIVWSREKLLPQAPMYVDFEAGLLDIEAVIDIAQRSVDTLAQRFRALPNLRLHAASILDGLRLIEPHLVLHSIYADIECRIAEGFFEKSPVGWLAMRLGHQSVARTEILEAGGFNESLDPDGWYADQEIGMRLKRHGLTMTAIRNCTTVHLQHRRAPGMWSREPEAFVNLYRDHPRIDVLLLEKYFKSRLPLRDYERLVVNVSGRGVPAADGQ